MPFQHTFTMPRAMAVALAVTSSSTAFAQAGGEISLEEVVITAQKREESVQNAALSVRAIAPDELIRAGVKDFTTLNKVAPEINVNAQQIGTVVAIRGVRSNAFSPSDESSNAIHVDGSYLAGFQGLRGVFFDIQRLEVLSGPQGTLYGRNSTGGSINIITNKPGHEFGGTASLEAGNYNLVSAEAALNLPFSDNFAMRAAGRHYKRDGYYKDSGLDDADQNSGRLSALWNISDTQTLWASADVQHEGGKGVGANIIATGPAAYPSRRPNGTTTALSPGVIVANGQYVTSPFVVVSGDPRRNAVLVGNADQARTNTQVIGYTAEYTHDLGFANWNVLGSHRELKQYQQGGTSQADLQPSFNVPATFSLQRANWQSFETRLTSSSTEPLKWVGGLYWFKQDLERAENGSWLTNVSASAVPPNPFTGLPAGGAGGTVSTNSPLGAGVVNTNGINDYNRVTAYAAFGEMTWSPISSLHLTAGARYNVDKKESKGSNYAARANLPPAVPPPPGIVLNPIFNTPYQLSDDWSQATWKINIAYDITETNRVYANVSKGYKAGGFSFGPRPRVEPEQVLSYEIGSKNEFFNNRVHLNAAAWLLTYDDYVTVVNQCINPDPSPALCGGNNAPNQAIGAINSGSARNIGASLSFDALVFTADRIGLSFLYVDAQYEDFDLSQNPVVAITARNDFTDTQVGFTAKYSGNASYTKVWQVGEGTLDAQLSAQYSSKRLLQNNAVPGSSAFIFSDAVTTLDFSLRYAPSKSWEVTGYVNNLTDELVKTASGPVGSAYQQGTPNVSYFTANYAPPRTFGVILGVKF